MHKVLLCSGGPIHRSNIHMDIMDAVLSGTHPCSTMLVQASLCIIVPGTMGMEPFFRVAAAAALARRCICICMNAPCTQYTHRCAPTNASAADPSVPSLPVFTFSSTHARGIASRREKERKKPRIKQHLTGSSHIARRPRPMIARPPPPSGRQIGIRPPSLAI